MWLNACDRIGCPVLARLVKHKYHVLGAEHSHFYPFFATPPVQLIALVNNLRTCRIILCVCASCRIMPLPACHALSWALHLLGCVHVCVDPSSCVNTLVCVCVCMCVCGRCPCQRVTRLITCSSECECGLNTCVNTLVCVCTAVERCPCQRVTHLITSPAHLNVNVA